MFSVCICVKNDRSGEMARERKRNIPKIIRLKETIYERFG